MDDFDLSPAERECLAGVVAILDHVWGSIQQMRAALEPHLDPDERAQLAQRRAANAERAQQATSKTALWQAIIGPDAPLGTPDGDLRLLCRRSDKPEAEAALERTAARIPWQPQRAAKQRLWQRAADEETSYAAVKSTVLQTALLLALADRDRPQTLRLGPKWVTGLHGKQLAIVPALLGDGDDLAGLWRWLCVVVPKWAEADVLNLNDPSTPADVLALDPKHLQRWANAEGDEDGGGMADLPDADPEADPVHCLLTAEPAEITDPRLQRGLDRATPRQGDIVTLLAEGDCNHEIATLLNISPQTVRTQLHRFRKAAM